MLHLLKRHPIPIKAHFERCLVLTYAFPERALAGLMPPGLAVDAYEGLGFVAAAFVQTRALRPAFLPVWCGADFFLAGYRVFVRHRTPDGRSLRGLRILRSDADRRAMVWGGNLLTHYSYRFCRARVRHTGKELSVRIRSGDGLADVDLSAHLEDAGLPEGSPFRDVRAARRFAGPLPFTFDYESATGSIIRIKGVRERWSPRLAGVHVRRLGFLEREPLCRHTPTLASAFYVADIPYRWERGVVEHPPGVAA